MTKVQCNALRIWTLILWTALWCWFYTAIHGEPIQYLLGIEINAMQFCVTGWFLPWLPRGIMQLAKVKHKSPSK